MMMCPTWMMWIWSVVGILLIVLLIVVIVKLLKKLGCSDERICTSSFGRDGSSPEGFERRLFSERCIFPSPGVSRRGAKAIFPQSPVGVIS